uniref:Uncharacterized protein n=1 Tax=Moniliophthora roreri TaxID=221103 RepID=A0A0W0FH13_MONRR
MQNFGQQSTSSSNTSYLQAMGPSPMNSSLPGLQTGQSIANDPNSVDTFKQNIQMILENVIRIQGVASSALAGIKNAYYLGSSSAQTQADLATLQQNLHILSDMMRHSGVGALPLLASPPSVSGPTNDSSLSNDIPMPPEPTVPTEDQMQAQASHAIQVLYDRLKKLQDTAGVVANLLGPTQMTGGLPLPPQSQGFAAPQQQFSVIPTGLGGGAGLQGNGFGSRGASQT